MQNLLGLSIDVNAIGWALIDKDSKKIISMGSRIFPIACENYGSGKRELSKRAYKRGKRTTRLRYQRRRKRKIKVLTLLSQHKLCPISEASLEKYKKQKQFPEEELKFWFRMNPYKLRVKAIEEPISLLELGRILYQVTLRRGFPVSERNRGKKENTMYFGSPIQDRIGINQTLKEKQNVFLGTYLNSLLPEENQTYTYTNQRVRNRYLTRELFQEELNSIWNVQEKYHPELTPELKKELIGDQAASSTEKGAVFFQRPLKSQKFKVGRCPYEPQKPKCAISSLTYQELLAYRWANSLKRNGTYLSPRERDTAKAFFLTNKRFEFSRILNLFEKSDGHYNIKENEIIRGSFVNASLSHPQLFDTSWFGLSEKEREDIWHNLYFFNDESKLKTYFMTQWGFDDYQAKKIASIQLDKNYAPISRKAARNILYFLKRGVVYDLAVILAGVKNSLGVHWDTIAETDINYIIHRVSQLYKDNKGEGFVPKLLDFIRNEMHISMLPLSKLYGIELNEKKIKRVSKFPVDKQADKEIRNLKSPHLVNATFQLRKILNELIEVYGPIVELKAELSANIKLNKFQRYLNKLDQKRREGLRARYIDLLGNRAENITPMNLTKYELWEECKQTCPYTGVHITLAELFTEAVQIVYIQPWKYSLNDSHWNKTLCLKSFSKNILEYSPYEYYNTHNAEEWGIVVKRAGRLFSNTKLFPSSYRKFKRFIKKHNHRDPLKHQLMDPNVLSRNLKNYLCQGIEKVSVSPGHSTPLLLDKWRLQKLFSPEVYENNQLDFRYHALLGYINANRSKKYIRLLAAENKYDPYAKRAAFPEPYQGFLDELEYHIHSILVSHKKANKLMTSRKHKTKKGEMQYESYCLSVRGSIHKETIFGKRTSPEDLQEAYHIRKNLTQIKTQKQVSKIVDPEVRKAVLESIEYAGGFIGETVPNNAFFSKDQLGYSVPKVFLPNKKGDPVPIKSVRVREMLSGVVQLKNKINQYVNLRNNHHVLIYINQARKYDEEVVTFWEAIRRFRFGEPIYQLPEDGVEFVTTLQINDLFLLDIEDSEVNLEQESKSFIAKHLYRVQKLSSKFYEFRLVHHNETNLMESPYYIRINNFGHRKTGWKTHNPIKVWINSIGKLYIKDEAKELKASLKIYS
ncbi:MAG: HNH endonuclease domain-containing protein [Flavobacteriaceae bacterium]